jgi:hypothetical protein
MLASDADYLRPMVVLHRSHKFFELDVCRFLLHHEITSQPAEWPVPAKSLMACSRVSALAHLLT